MILTTVHPFTFRAFPRSPRSNAPVLFAFLKSVSLFGALSAAITAVNTGIGSGFAARWLHAYALALGFAFPTVTIVAPRARALVERLSARTPHPREY